MLEKRVVEKCWSAYGHTSSWSARGLAFLPKQRSVRETVILDPNKDKEHNKTSQDTPEGSQDPKKSKNTKKKSGNKGSMPERRAPTWLPQLLLLLSCNACTACAADTPKLFGISSNEFAGCFETFPPGPLNLRLGNQLSGFVEESALVAYMAPRAPGAFRLSGALCHDAVVPAAVSVGWHADSLRRSSRAVVMRFLHNLGLGSTILCLIWLLHHNTPKKQKQKQKVRNKLHVKGFHFPKKHRMNRHIGICRKVGCRRFTVVSRKYRSLGKRKRIRLLQQQFRSRTTGRNVSQHFDKIGQRSQNGLLRVRKFLLGDQLNSWLEGWLSGNVSFSLLRLLLDFCWDPWKGTRVGEASNPGPAASRATRNERSWDLPPETQSKDAALAQALLSVLENFQGQQPKDPAAEEPPKKKGKGGVVPKPQGPSLAQSLIQVLQSALQNQWSDSQIIDGVTTKIKKHMDVPDRTQQQPTRAVRFADPRDFSTISEVTPNPSDDGQNFTKGKGKTLKPARLVLPGKRKRGLGNPKEKGNRVPLKTRILTRLRPKFGLRSKCWIENGLVTLSSPQSPKLWTL